MSELQALARMNYGLPARRLDGAFDVGGGIDELQVLANYIKNPLAPTLNENPAIGEFVADATPGVSDYRAIQRIGRLIEENKSLEARPIRRLLNNADMVLEGAGIAANAVPLLKGGAIALGGLLPMMARNVDSTPGLLRSQRGGVGSELPMDEASRMQRAKDMGFDVDDVLYHQTSPNNEESIIRDGFDIRRLGARASETDLPDGVYMKSHSRDIGLDGLSQIPLHIKKGNYAQYIDRDEVVSHLRSNQKTKDLIDKWEAKDRKYDSEFEKTLQDSFEDTNQDPNVDVYGDKLDQILSAWDADQNESAKEIRKAITEFYKEQGYDGIKLIRDAGSGGRMTDTTIVFNPNHIRSINAKFDPAKKNSSNLMASGLLGAVGLNQLQNDNELQ